ncbi:MAG: hypothetical protein C5B47_03615 [Verrucomicrobia bacterium]|nr:MAG: hypothetical protein C5B47_03615 [Verrucomicrobiota bacterium]
MPAEALSWLYSTQRIGIKLGLDNIRSLLSLLESPERQMSFVHVAGTNGKGSVCAFTDSILRAQGYKTGLFTSPHLVAFQERIRAQGEPISLEEIAEGLTLLKEIIHQMDNVPTFFEITTALAIWYFQKKDVEVAVWETGMGGRWDATNVVTPLVSVITPVAFDHKEWLGNTLTKIASEKAGIFKPGVPAVSAPQLDEAAEELRRVADSQRVPLRFIEKPHTVSPLGLRGPHQQWNAALAVESIKSSGLIVTEKAILRGLFEVQWLGRFQMLSSRLIVDGAHNPTAISALISTWRETFKEEKARVVFGSLKDKESEEMLRILSEIAREFLFVSLENPRSRPAIEYRAPLAIPARHFENSEAALSVALNSNELILVTGSLFLVGEILAQFNKLAYQSTNQ